MVSKPSLTKEEQHELVYNQMRENNIAYRLHYSPDEPDVLWAPVIIDGIELPYKISTYGDLIGPTGLPISATVRPDGYLQYNMHYQGKQYTSAAHRLVAETFIPNDDPSNKTQVDHVYGNKADNWWRVLEWVTPKENVARAWKLGLCDEGLPRRCGEGNGKSKYSESIIRNICERLEKGITPAKISSELAIPVTLVHDIQYGSWKIISKDYKITDETGKPLYTTRTMTTGQVTEACELMAQGMRPYLVARKLNIPLGTIYSLRRGTQYKEIVDNYNFEKVNVRSVSDVDAHKICQLYQSGKMPIAIHRELPYISIEEIRSVVRNNDCYRDICDQYDFTLVPRVRDRTVSNDTVHLICKMLEKGKLPAEISRQTGVKVGIVKSIRDGSGYRDISEKYTFPDNFKKFNRKYDSEIVHKICKYLQDGIAPLEISQITGVDLHDIRNIRVHHAYTDISKEYKFPKTFIPHNLSDEQVKKICEDLQCKKRVNEIANEMGIDPKWIYSIKMRKSYKDISKDYIFYKKDGSVA